MKKLVSLLFGTLIVFSFTSIAYAGGGYVSANIGAVVLSDIDFTEPGLSAELESDTGYALGIALGYAYDNNIRAEVELAYQENDIDKISMLGVTVDAGGDTSSLAFLLNGYYDFANNSAFTPFISAGIGWAKVEVDNFSIGGIIVGNDDDSVFAYQVGAGVGFAVSEKVTLDLKYRYFATADPEFDTTEAEYASHNIYFGIRFSF